MSTRPGPRYMADACNAEARWYGVGLVKRRHTALDALDTHWSGYYATDSTGDYGLLAIHDWYVNGVQGGLPAKPGPDALDRGEPIDGDASRRWQTARVSGPDGWTHWPRMADHPHWEPSDDRGHTSDDEDAADLTPTQLELFTL